MSNEWYGKSSDLLYKLVLLVVLLVRNPIHKYVSCPAAGARSSTATLDRYAAQDICSEYTMTNKRMQVHCILHLEDLGHHARVAQERRAAPWHEDRSMIRFSFGILSGTLTEHYQPLLLIVVASTSSFTTNQIDWTLLLSKILLQ